MQRQMSMLDVTSGVNFKIRIIKIKDFEKTHRDSVVYFFKKCLILREGIVEREKGGHSMIPI